ncbi:actin cortical patch SUR7/pH-response regulator pali [Dipodascopsis uninucleata]
MAAGRDCLIISFPFLATVASIVLMIFVLIGSLKDFGVLSKLYFLRINVEDLSVTVDGATFTKPSTIADFYQTGLWDYCQGTISGSTYTVTNCSKVDGIFSFNPVKIIESQTGYTIPTSVISGSLQKILDDVEPLSKAMVILFCAGTILAFIEVFSGFFSFRSRGGSLCSMILAALATVCLFASTVIASAMFVIEYKAINDSTDSIGVTATIGRTMFGIMWGAVVASALATIFWLFSICCGSTRSSRSEKQFVYSPVEPAYSTR